MIKFSINVAFVIGSFIHVPKQAHSISVSNIKTLVTPKVVIESKIIVETIATKGKNCAMNIAPRASSTKGYAQP